MHLPFRRMNDTFPSTSLSSASGSGAVIASPRVKTPRVRDALCDQSMSEEPASAANEHDIAFSQGSGIDPLYHKRISGPNRGQHAPSTDLKAQSPIRAEHFSGKFALDGVDFVRFPWGKLHHLY